MTRPNDEMAAYDPGDEPRGPLSGSQLLAIAGGAMAAWAAFFGLVWLLWRGVS